MQREDTSHRTYRHHKLSDSAVVVQRKQDWRRRYDISCGFVRFTGKQDCIPRIHCGAASSLSCAGLEAWGRAGIELAERDDANNTNGGASGGCAVKLTQSNLE